jgi:hypothetical protein
MKNRQILIENLRANSGDVRRRSRKPQHLQKTVTLKDRVAIQEQQVLATYTPRALVIRSAEARIHTIAYTFDCRKLALEHICRSVIRIVINHDYFIQTPLIDRRNRLEAGPDEIAGIETHDDYGYVYLAHVLSAPLPPLWLYCQAILVKKPRKDRFVSLIS